MKIKTRDLTLGAMFAALTAIGAFTKVPIPYVPFTLQFFFCAMAGILLGSKIGALSQFIYIIIGLAGIPVFADGGGIGYVLKPSFGYLLGFMGAAFIMGKIMEHIKGSNLGLGLGLGYSNFRGAVIKYITVLGVILCGEVVLYIFGLAYLYIIMNFYLKAGKSVGWIFVNGCQIFILKDFVQSLVISFVVILVMPSLKKAKLLK